MPKNIVIGQKVSSTMWSTAKQLRRAMTPEEKILWQKLRANRLGFHFRRQQIIDKYVVDFYCNAAALVVELDGEYHNSQIESDQKRDADLTGRGMRVLRFKNEMIHRDLEIVLKQIGKTCCERIDPTP